MITIIYIEHDGQPHAVDATSGTNLMQLAVDHGIAGILGDCGGACSCATCHVYVDPAWQARLPAIGTDEQMTLECAADPQPGSRLACQLLASPALDGLILQLPKTQI